MSNSVHELHKSGARKKGILLQLCLSNNWPDVGVFLKRTLRFCVVVCVLLEDTAPKVCQVSTVLASCSLPTSLLFMKFSPETHPTLFFSFSMFSIHLRLECGGD